MPREPKHASNRQAEEVDAELADMPLSKRQAAIDGIAPSRNELKKHPIRQRLTRSACFSCT